MVKKTDNWHLEIAIWHLQHVDSDHLPSGGMAPYQNMMRNAEVLRMILGEDDVTTKGMGNTENRADVPTAISCWRCQRIFSEEEFSDEGLCPVCQGDSVK